MKKLLLIILISLSGKVFSQQGQFRKLDSTIVGTYATGAATAAMDFFVVTPFLKEAMARYSTSSIVMMVYDTVNQKYGWQTIPSGGGGGGTVYVDSIWRVAGIDSFYWRKNGVTTAVKDSIGSGGGGSGITVGTTTITSGTSGRVAFNNAGVYGESANLFWDNSNANLGIGTTPSSSHRLDIYKNTNGITSFRVKNDNAGASAQVQTQLENNSGNLAYYGISSSGFSGYAPLNGGKAFFGGNGVIVSMFTQSNFPIEFYTNGVYRGEISNGGDWQLGSATPHAGSQTLQVTGDASVTGNTTLGSGAVANSTVAIGGSLAKQINGKTAAYTATAADGTINCTSGTFTVTLPTAVGITGRIYTIKNSGAGVITVDADGTETIDGATTVTLSTQYNSISIQSNGANWITEAKIESPATYDAGTGAPTLTVVANITGTPTVTTSYYQQIGDVVEQWGEITFDPTTTATDTELRISLLVSSTISNTYQLVGSATSDVLNETMNIKGDVSNGAAVLKCKVVDVNSRTVSYRFKYKYIPA